MTWTTSAARGEALAKRHWIAVQEKPVRYSLMAAMGAYLFTLNQVHQGNSAELPVDQAAIDLSLLTITPATVIMIAALLFALQQFAHPSAASGRRMSPLVASNRQNQPIPLLFAPQSLGAEAHDGLMSRLNHDLRTPLNAMLGFADLMNAEAFGPLGDDRYRTYAAHIQTCGRELLSATETTLAMAALLTRPNQSEFVSSRLKDLILNAWANTADVHVAKSCTLTLQMPEEIMVRGDAHAIQQGLINLLGAAITRAGTNGTVSVQALSGHGRINALISVLNEHRLHPATTGCRAATSAWPSVEDMPITVSRTLFGLQGIPFVEATAITGQWTVSLSLEAASQADLFDVRRAVGQNAVTNWYSDHSTDFFGGASFSRSRSA